MILIKNGEVHVGNGEVYNNCDVLIDKDKIVKVEKNIEVKSDFEVIDATNKVVFPGFIDTMNSWGAKGPAWGDDDLGEHTDPIAPHLNSVYAFDHDAMNFQSVYEYGVTSFGFSPSIYNVIGGKSCVFKTYGHNPYNMLIKEDVAMVASVSSSAKSIYRNKKMCPMTKLGIYALLKQALIDAKNYRIDGEYNSKNAELKRVIDKELQLFINCTTKADIDSINLLLKEFDLDVVLTGAYCITDSDNYSFKKVVLGNLTDSMLTYNYKMDIEAINKMINKGALFSISSCGDSNGGGKETLLWNGILYYQRGIDAEEVVKMLTLNPAKILRVEDRVGSIEVGKDADIVVWSNNPILTFDAKVTNSFISGQDIMKVERRTSCW